MSRRVERLTTRRVNAIKKPGRHADGGNLYLQVSETGVKSWLLRYSRHGRERWLGLGPVHTFSLAEARERAREARQQLKDGVDPLLHRREKHAAQALEESRHITFEDAARAYFKQNESRWANRKHRSNFITSLERFAFPVVGRLRVSDIETGHVLRVLEPIWATKNETASKLRQRVQAVLDWATVRGHRIGENPARWRGHLENVLPPPAQVQRTVHHPAMKFEDLPGFMPELRARHGIAPRALELMILTATRTNEIIEAVWSEVDLKHRVWTIPAARMRKTGRAHRVPLSDRAVEILQEVPREDGNPHLFVSPHVAGAGLSNAAMAQALKKMHAARAAACEPPWADRETGVLAVPHGFRSSFRDWAGERTAYANHVVETALSHQVGSEVERSYRRGDLLEKRARLMADWAKYCCGPVAGGNVVGMRETG
jgi:integrase